MLSDIIAKILIMIGIAGGTAYFVEGIVRIMLKYVKWVKTRRRNEQTNHR